jgi:predicted glycosyltransferase
VRLRILIHALSLSGAGHYVRARALAGALAEAHEVVLTDAGRPVALALPPGVRSLALERLQRDAAGLRADRDTAEALEHRAAQLVGATESLRPDIVIVEHYPFSKWALAGEIEALIAAARRVRPGTRVICSVRDFPLQTRHEPCDAPSWRARVIETLHERFDAVLHHADPVLVPFGSVFPDADRLRIPVHATGLVHRLEPDDVSLLPAGLDGARFALCSVGGGRDGAGLQAAVRGAWAWLRARRDGGGFDRLVLCGGEPVGSPSRDEAEGVLALPFVPRFDVLLRRACVSLSHAGYNTCADVLRYGVPSLLVPHPEMSDQAPRAALMARIGAARVLPAAALAPDALARAMEAARATGPSDDARRVDLSGALEARHTIESWATRLA